MGSSVSSLFSRWAVLSFFDEVRFIRYRAGCSPRRRPRRQPPRCRIDGQRQEPGCIFGARRPTEVFPPCDHRTCLSSKRRSSKFEFRRDPCATDGCGSIPSRGAALP
jgi:hypothetical protein